MSRLIFTEVTSTPSDTDNGSGQVYLKDNGGLYFKNASNTEVVLLTGADTTSVWVSGNGAGNINYTGGKVGIGTTAPSDLLTVGDGTGSVNITINKSDAGTAALEFEVAGTDKCYLRCNTSEDLIFGTADSDRMSILASNGNVGIGTATPQGLLHIKHATNSTHLSANHIFGISTGGISISAVPVAKAWVNFDGTGTLAVNDSYNVSGVTDNGSGDYTINFATAMSNANYCPVFGHWTGDGDGNNTYQKQGVALAVGSIRVSANNISVGDADSQGNYVAIFGA